MSGGDPRARRPRQPAARLRCRRGKNRTSPSVVVPRRPASSHPVSLLRRPPRHRSTRPYLPAYPLVRRYAAIYPNIACVSPHSTRPAYTVTRHAGCGGRALISRRAAACQRRRPPELAGLWELPGGKVAAGRPNPRLWCVSWPRNSASTSSCTSVSVRTLHRRAVVLRAYRVSQTGGRLHPHDHGALRWVGAAELSDVAWVPADRASGCPRCGETHRAVSVLRSRPT